MGFCHRVLASACLAVLTSGCATFGTNVEGDFTCRAPKGDCAPSQVIDARATRDLSATGPVQDGPRPPVSVASGDQGRTSERTLRIVFPAHIDETGTLHDDAVAWAVVENPRWAAELRRKAGEDTAPPLMRQLRRQLKAAQAKSDLLEETTTLPAAEQPEAETFDLGQPFQPSSSIEDIPSASPLVLPSTAREAVAGASAPAVEGFDMAQPPHDRTPRPSADKAPLIYPTIEAIEAAKNAAKAQKEPK
ncbi:conjugal transfer protein TraV [Novosphingobium resinovorum]|uniref:conjugal transfer protein TraV n=1 Tax=Novosphingobium TaxID=165696 RepID=UPI001B3C6D3A|nr:MULTISPECIES: conjugal transfer protein TraV [Novosphingobium]MBF7011858.1 conjugal transfer protein TraV [Novosphingobium sp. HR1a]WJM26609.1 conjugal transfer protein TraV [Novosphingobium resinovorum]